MSLSEGGAVPSSGADTLLAQVVALKVEYGLERSIKVLPGVMCTTRFLVSFHKADLGHHPTQTLAPLCRALNMPAGFYPIFEQEVTAAGFIHFAYEESATERIYKLYLEFPASATLSVDCCDTAPSHPPAWLVHKAMKWDADKPERCTVALYRKAPDMTSAETASWLQNMFEDPQGGAAQFALALFSLVEQRIGLRDIFLLQVEEEHNPRCSFDMNLYDAVLTLGDLASLLLPVFERFGHSKATVLKIVAPLANDVLGHLSGGVDRHGREFFSIYFGVKPCAPE